ncbi:MAG: threonine synthase [Pseudomonadota bacterium]
MRYISTRGEAPVLGFEDVLLAGLARDGGLYVPETWPQLSPAQIAAFAGKPYDHVATEVIWPFIDGEIERRAFEAMAQEAYASFRHPAVTPLVQIGANRWILELFHGPTLAFKDVAMQLLARMMEHVLTKRDLRATIVGATSGDTGGAAIEAFRGLDRADVFILYPAGRVSDVQRRMMTTLEDANIHTLEIDGTFDDCQAIVKTLFANDSFRETSSLSGVNSINWARIVPQIAYYFYAAANLGAPYRPISFSVPTGNFGDIFAGYAAKRMGLAVDRLIIASNSNDILPRTVASGVYEKRGVKATTSPSMDIQVSSNFERYLFELQGRDAATIRGQMASLAQSGRFELNDPDKSIARELGAYASAEGDIADCVRQTVDASGYMLEPHTACGVLAADHCLDDVSNPEVVLATAHPAKFAEAMTEIVGEPVSLPTRLHSLLTAEERMTPLGNDAKEVESYILQHSRAAAQG